MKLLAKICAALALCALIIGLQGRESPVHLSWKSLLAPSTTVNVVKSRIPLGQEPSTWLKAEAGRMNQVDPNPEATQRDLEETAANLSTSQMQSLAAITLNQEGALNERLLALYLLRLNKNVPSEIFERIALLEETERESHHSQPVETALVLSALEEIELRSLANRQEIGRLLRIANLAKNPKVASIFPQLIRAAENGNPFYLEAQK